MYGLTVAHHQLHTACANGNLQCGRVNNMDDKFQAQLNSSLLTYFLATYPSPTLECMWLACTDPRKANMCTCGGIQYARGEWHMGVDKGGGGNLNFEVR